MIVTNDSENVNQLIIRNDLLWIESWEKGETDDSLILKLLSEFELIAKKQHLKNL